MKKSHRRAFAGLIAPALLFELGGCVSSRSTLPNHRVVDTVADTTVDTTSARLELDVRTLVSAYPMRSSRDRGQLNAAGMWVASRFESMGYVVEIEPVSTLDGSEAFNVIAELRGTTKPDEIVIIGAHYDAEVNTPGADDNASGVAGMLELAQRFSGQPMARTVRWIGFTNEESSNSRGGAMGSFVHALGCKRRDEQVVGMMSLEMIGYFRDEPDSQRYPFPTEMAEQFGLTLPTVGDFIGIVGRFGDRDLIDAIGAAMNEAGTIPVVPVALPAQVSAIYRSDNAHFWMRGYSAVMVTDTSEHRTPHYHRMSDTPDTLDFVRMGGVVDGLDAAIRSLARE